MSIISQITIVLLAFFILVILFKANRDLEEAAATGEHFVDSWAMAQEKLEFRKRNTGSENVRYEEEEDLVLPGGKEEPSVSQPQEDASGGAGEETGGGLILEAFDEIYRNRRQALVDRLPFFIGRGKENDLILDDLSVARKHARIRWTNGSYVLDDLGSVGGIITDGSRVRTLILSDGLLFYLGNTQITVKTTRTGIGQKGFPGGRPDRMKEER